MKQQERFEMRVSQEFMQLVDEFRRDQADIPPRAEAIRRLVVAGNAFRAYDIMALVSLACVADRGPIDQELIDNAMKAVDRITERLDQTPISDRTIGIEDIIRTVEDSKTS